MTPQQQAVYAQFMPLVQLLLGEVAALARMPLDDMRAVAERLTLTGALVGNHQGVPVDPAKATRLRDLVMATIDYTQTALAIAATAGEAG